MLKRISGISMAFIIGLSNIVSVSAITKKETVYTKLNYDGSVKNTLVNNQLINNNKDDVINDNSILENIMNINNDSTYEKEDNKLKWNSNGKDIYYQGTTDKKLPIGVDISYKLDDKLVNIDDILGKKGRIEITIKYHNYDKHDDLYTPFTIMMGTIIDSVNNSNIAITNGKIVSTGTKDIIIGMTAPGLYESLDVEELKDIDTIVISYDTNDFSVPNIYNVVTPKLIDSSDLEVFDKMESVYSSVNSLATNMNIIEDGSKKLKDGSNELKSKLKSSMDELVNNHEDALNNEQINMIENQVMSNVKSKFNDTYKEQIGNMTWNKVKENMKSDEKIEEIVTRNVTNSVTQAVSNVVPDVVTNSVTETVKEYISTEEGYNNYVNCETGKAIMQQGGEMTAEQINSCKILELVQNIATSSATKAGRDAAIKSSSEAAKNASVGVANEVSMYVAENVSKEVASSVSEESALNTASEVSKSLAPTIANQVKDASIKKVSESLGLLYDGVSLLDDGVNSLSDGISKYNQEGISKISNLVNNTIKDKTNKIEKLTKLSDNYKSFASNNNGDNDETKFILVVDSKKKIENKKEEKQEDKKISLWDRIVGLFK